MEDYLKIIVEIYPREKKVYIAEENSSGSNYSFNDISELSEKIHFYLENYCKKEIEQSKNIQGGIEIE